MVHGGGGGRGGTKVQYIIAKQLILMYLFAKTLLKCYYNGGRPISVHTNLTNSVKNSQWTFTNVPSAIRWVTSKGYLSVCLRNEGF